VGTVFDGILMDNTGQTEKLLAQIRDAFQGVELCVGVGLQQALVHNCFGGEEEQQEARLNDEQHDWQKMIAIPDMNRSLDNAIAFFDALGARFHLPVCLTLSVMNPEQNYSMLNALDPFHYEAHQLLNAAQQQCVRDVLQFVFSQLPQRGFPYYKSDLVSYWDVNSTDEDRMTHHLQELQKLGCLVTHNEVIYTIETIDGTTTPS